MTVLGFAVGIIDEKNILGSHLVKPGDRLMAFPSSGFHSNGFSLLRKVLGDEGEIDNWKDELMKPTKLYPQPIQKLLQVDKERGVHALAHITGGGIDNLCRVMPPNTKAQLKEWEIPQPFLEMERKASLSRISLLKTFNCGIGMTAIVDSHLWDFLFQKACEVNLSPIDLGTIEVSSLNQPTWTIKGVQ